MSVTYLKDEAAISFVIFPVSSPKISMHMTPPSGSSSATSRSNFACSVR